MLFDQTFVRLNKSMADIYINFGIIPIVFLWRMVERHRLQLVIILRGGSFDPDY